LASCTITDGSIGTAVPRWRLIVPALSAMVLAVPAVPVAVKVTGLPVSVPDVAVQGVGPRGGPERPGLAVAIPFVPVSRASSGSRPPPDATANVTATPATGYLFASRTITDGSTGTAVPAGCWLLPALSAIVLAVPAAPVALKVTGLPVSQLQWR